VKGPLVALVALLLSGMLLAQQYIVPGRPRVAAAGPTFYSDDFNDTGTTEWTEVGSSNPTHTGTIWKATSSTTLRSVSVEESDIGSVDMCVKFKFDRVGGADTDLRIGALLRNTTGDDDYYAVFCDNYYNNCKLESYTSGDSFQAGTNDTCSETFDLADAYYIACVDGTGAADDTRVALYHNATDQDATWNEPDLDNWGDPQCCWQEVVGGGTIGSTSCNDISVGVGSWAEGEHEDSGTYGGLIGWNDSNDGLDDFVSGTAADFNFP
jgi:hypothetical protein